MAGSLAFRKNKEDIFKGKPPEKYLRILPYVGGSKVLEFGAAEGVLSLLMSESKDRVIAVERNRSRLEEGL